MANYLLLPLVDIRGPDVFFFCQVSVLALSVSRVLGDFALQTLSVCQGKISDPGTVEGKPS